MIQPRIGQRVTVELGDKLESGVTGTVTRLSRPWGGEVTIRSDGGGSFITWPCRLRPADEKST